MKNTNAIKNLKADIRETRKEMKYFPTFNAKDEQEANYIAGVLAMRQIETRIESVPQDGNKFVVSVPWGLESRAVSVYFGLA